jgi:hypothetical protein
MAPPAGAECTIESRDSPSKALLRKIGQFAEEARVSNKIIFNGTEYDSLEAMPLGLRKAYQEALRLAGQGGMGNVPRGGVAVRLSTKVRFVNEGKTYDSVDQMPAEVRAKFDAAMQQVDMDHDGVPDFLESNPAAPATVEPAFQESPRALSDALAPSTLSPSVITPDQPNNRLLVAAGLAVLFLLLVVFGLVLYIIQH